MTTIGCLVCNHIWDNCTCDDRERIEQDRDIFEGLILPREQKQIARHEFKCSGCGYLIQKQGNYWRTTDKGGINPMMLCYTCKEARGI